jgi:hypothetical protein
MGIADILGFGKKKVPFRIPREVSELRTRIETENKENYPNLVRYQEIMTDAKLVYKKLHDIIAEKEFAEEAGRVAEDLKHKLDRLTEKIKRNKQETKKEGKQDYLEKNIDYLERKSIRNNAKTLFTEFLEAHELFITCCKDGSVNQGAALDSATSTLISTMSKLHNNFFETYGQDAEIQGLKDRILVKISDLASFLEQNKGPLEEKGLKPRAESSFKKLSAATKELSSK